MQFLELPKIFTEFVKQEDMTLKTNFFHRFECLGMQNYNYEFHFITPLKLAKIVFKSHFNPYIRKKGEKRCLSRNFYSEFTHSRLRTTFWNEDATLTMSCFHTWNNNQVSWWKNNKNAILFNLSWARRFVNPFYQAENRTLVKLP